MARIAVELKATDAYRANSYGVVLESHTVHAPAGRGFHNPHHPHRFEVWINRERDGVLVDPHGNPTGDAFSVLCAPQVLVISAHPDPHAAPRGQAFTIGDEVTLLLAGHPLGTFRVEARPLHNPHLVQVETAREAAEA